MNGKARVLLDAFSDLGDGAVVVEIGCVRFDYEVPSDGWSTVYLAQAALKHGWTFHSVDIDAGAVGRAVEAVGNLPAIIHHSDGERFLRAFPHQIDGLYLDGAADPAQALAQYNVASLAPSAVIAVDDIQLIKLSNGARYEQGKGTLVLDKLIEDGFTVRILPTETNYQMAVATR